MRTFALLLVGVLAGSAGCSSDGATALPDLSPPVDPLVAARPYTAVLPGGHSDAKSWPFVLVIHGYGATGFTQDAYMGMSAQADARQAVVAFPDGTPDTTGKRFWNATDACCDFTATNVDDVAYLTAVIDDAIVRYHVDPKRVFVIGHSNGAFMAHRLACERTGRIAAFAAFAGEVWDDTTRCVPTEKIAVAQIHGDADATIHYEGGVLMDASYPSTPTTYGFWKAQAGCTGEMDEPARDLVDELPGAETSVTRATGCAPGGGAELWKIAGGVHVPFLNQNFSANVYDFFFAHAR